MEDFFRKLGLDAKESKIILAVLKLGPQPASVVANYLKMDRTSSYRILQNLYKRRLLAKSHRKGATVFYLDKLSDIEHFIKKEQERFDNLREEFMQLTPQLHAMKSARQEVPTIQIYDGFEKLPDFYRDIIVRAKEQALLQIRILGSNTLSQNLEKNEMGDLISHFQKSLQENAIEADVLIAQGNLTREWLTHLKIFEDFATLPAGGGATNVILVGQSVFMVSFREFPVGLKIDHPDIAQTMHFLFDVAGKFAAIKNQFSE